MEYGPIATAIRDSREVVSREYRRIYTRCAHRDFSEREKLEALGDTINDLQHTLRAALRAGL